jgi:hypothetical protein
MKLKLAIFAILASTISLIGLIYAMINHTGIEAKKSDPKEIKSKNNNTNKNSTSSNNFINTNNTLKNELNENNLEDDEYYELNDNYSMSEQDKKIIDALTSLSDNALNTELSSLKERIEKTDLVTQLESGKLDEAKTLEAKATLERFALLGLEGTRRKYAQIEPELKDAVFAHRDSLKEIREMLSEY